MIKNEKLYIKPWPHCGCQICKQGYGYFYGNEGYFEGKQVINLSSLPDGKGIIKGFNWGKLTSK